MLYTDYDVLGRHHTSSGCFRSPNPNFLSSVRDGTHLENNHTSTDHWAGNDSVRADPGREYEILTMGRGRAAAIPQVIQGPIPQPTAPPLRAQGNDAAAFHETLAVRQEHGPVVERAGNHTATGNRATVTLDVGGLNSAAVVRNPQTVSGVPEQVQGCCGRYSKNTKGTIQAKAWHIGFYPSLWTCLLETAKAEMQHALFH